GNRPAPCPPLHAAAGRGVGAVPAVVGCGRDTRQLDVFPDHRVRDVPGLDHRERPGRLLLAPLVGLGGGAVVVRVDARTAQVPVHTGADTGFIGLVIGVGLVGV